MTEKSFTMTQKSASSASLVDDQIREDKKERSQIVSSGGIKFRPTETKNEPANKNGSVGFITFLE